MAIVEPTFLPALSRRLAGVVPANLQMNVVWEAIRRARESAKAAGLEQSPSLMLAWCITRAMTKHAPFRGRVQDNGSIAVRDDFDLGISVALDHEQLATATIREANRLDWAAFAEAYRRAVAETRAGRHEETQAPLIFTNLGACGIEVATPIVVPPAMCTLVAGQAHVSMIGERAVVRPEEVVTLSLTFDHRVANGVGAAAFLLEVRREAERFSVPG